MVIAGDVVVELRPRGGLAADPVTGSAGFGDGVLDARGLLVVPGYIDLQINGGHGHDFTSQPESIWTVGEALTRYGVTAFLPTIVSSPASIVRRALDVMGTGPPSGYRGARPLGVHAEGPMVAEARRGAHAAAHLQAPSPEVIKAWGDSTILRMVTLAPELSGAMDIVRTLTDAGVVVAAGHSDASFEQAMASFQAGVGMGTHLFNAMSGLHHRRPGLAGALLARKDVPAGLIADGVHVHPGAVVVAWRAKGPEGLALVTDATAGLGCDPGPFPLGSVTVTVEGSTPRGPDGSLAGSVLGLDRAVRNLLEFTGCRTEEAVAAASATPARILGDPRRGRIEPGAAADLALLAPDLRVVATMVGGQVVFGEPIPAASERGGR